jgi:hypothetical protein
VGSRYGEGAIMNARDAEANQLRQVERGTNSARYQPRTFTEFEADTFAFDDARTHGSLALKIGRKVVVNESANAEQLAYAQQAGQRLQAAIAARRKPAPCTTLALYVPPIKLAEVIALPAPTHAEYMAWRAEWATASGKRRTELHELIVNYMDMMAGQLEATKQKAAMSVAA